MKTTPLHAHKSEPRTFQDLIIPGGWRFSGHLGRYIDRISEERILNRDNWNKIYPETEETFRLRDDDRDYPNLGEWRGEFWGKYLLSVIAAFRYYHSEELRLRIADAVKGLLSTQDANGYIGTYAHSDFVLGNNWNIWDRKYTLWGLLEAWEILQDEAVLCAARRFVDHLISEVGPGGIDIVKTGNFYGMPSSSILQPMVKLHVATGEKKYLDYAEYIVSQWGRQPGGLPDILNMGLSGRPVHVWFSKTDPYGWGKGYEFTSCVEGLLELYEATGNRRYFEAAEKIHEALVKCERTPVGSVSFNDMYVGSAGIINTVSEICDAVYWNRLSFKLFTHTGDEKYIGEIERTLYNSLLCAFNPEGAWGLRRLRMSHVHVPASNHFLDHHQCCTDNLPRGLFQAAEAALMAKGGSVYLGLFNEGEGSTGLPSGNEVTIKITGDFLSQSRVRAAISLNQTEEFCVLLRLPKWSRQTIVKVNGDEQENEGKGGWLPISRRWADGDVVDISFDLRVWWETFDVTRVRALFNPIGFYDEVWAQVAFIEGSNAVINQKYRHVKTLQEQEALPQKPAVTFFYGPLALSRDVRITEGDIFAPVRFSENAQSVTIRPIEAPKGIWKAFELNIGNDQIIKFCDFSSAGNTWDFDSKFNTWCILLR